MQNLPQRAAASVEPLEYGGERRRSAAAPALAGVAIAAAATMLFLFHLGVYGLWEPDEARYAEIAREMLPLHSFVVPHLNYVPYIEKPPMLYWLTALAMKLFGVNEFAARFTNAAAAVTGVIVVFWFALRTFDLKRAIASAAVLMTSALYAIMAQVLTTDMLLTTCVSIAFFSFYLHWREGGRWRWLMYGAVGIGTLVKGPVAIILPALAGAIFLTWERDWRGFARRFGLLRGIGLTALIAAPWFVAISIRQPDFVQFYFLGEYFKRAFEANYSHAEPLYYYIPVAIAGLLPWSLLIPSIPWRRLERSPARRFCLIAAAIVFVAFSLASAKLIPYILPMFPLLAIVLGDGLIGLVEARPWRAGLLAAAATIATAGACAIAIGIEAHRFTSPYPALVQPIIEIAGGVLLFSGILVTGFFWKRMNLAALGTLAGMACVILVLIDLGRVRAEPVRSYATLARAIAQRAPEATLICYPRYIQSLPFYCRRRVILIGPETELAYGAAHSPDGPSFFFHRRADLMRLWRAPQAPVLVIDRSALPGIASALGPYAIVAQDAKKLALRRSGEDK